MIILGCDPGASGAFALLVDGQIQAVHDMPVGEILVDKTKRKRVSPEMLGHMLRGMAPFVDAAYVEEVTAMPKQGVSSVFTFGQAHGMVLGALGHAGIRTVRIRPQSWQKTVKGRGDPRPRALELHPSQVDNLKRKKDEGRADAILIAHAGWLLETGRTIA